MDGSDLVEVSGEAIAHRAGQHGHPVAAAFRVADRDVTELEVDVLDPEPETLEDPHAGAIEQENGELNCALEVRQNRRNLIAAQHRWQATRLPGADHVVEPLEIQLEDVAVEKQDRRQRLPLGRNRDPSIFGKMGQISVEVVNAAAVLFAP